MELPPIIIADEIWAATQHRPTETGWGKAAALTEIDPFRACRLGGYVSVLSEIPFRKPAHGATPVARSLRARNEISMSGGHGGRAGLAFAHEESKANADEGDGGENPENI